MTDSTAQVTGTDVARVRSTGQFAGGPAAVTAFWAEPHPTSAHTVTTPTTAA
jgi:hypothetical protein